MRKKFQWPKYLVSLFAGIFAIAGTVVVLDTPAKAASWSTCSTGLSAASITSGNIVVDTSTAGKCIITFKNNQTFTLPTGVNFLSQALVVGGGGGGGFNSLGAGGGGGRVLHRSTDWSLSNASSLEIVIGNGGADGWKTTSNWVNGDNGGDTYISKPGSELIRAGGGGGGCGAGTNPTNFTGSAGGACHMGTQMVAPTVAIANWESLANNGGAAGGGGGGGAGAAGADGTGTKVGGDGVTRFGLAVGAGGGGWGNATGALGGGPQASSRNIGGQAIDSANYAAANADRASGSDGLANTGSGGGAARNGGSGVVKIAYSIPRTVTFDANGGSGTMAAQTANGGTINSNTFSAPTGSFFAGWATTSNASSATYLNGASFSFSADTTLFAVWTKPVINLDASDSSSLPSSGASWTSIAPGTSSLSSTAIGNQTYSAGPPKSLTLPNAGHVNMGANNAANISGALTVEVWAKCNAYRAGDVWNILASKWFSSPTGGGGTAANDWHFGIYGNKLNLYTTNSVYKAGNTSWNSTNCSTWHQFAFTIDPSNNNTLTLYVDGVVDGTFTGVTHTTNTASILMIGDGRQDVAFQGNYSKFRMYSTALTSAQMEQNFTSGAASLSAISVTYKAGANGTGDDISQSFTNGNSVTLNDSSAAIIRSGYSISGWSTTDGGAQTHALSATYSTNANLTVYPVWSANSYTITYKAGASGTGSDLTQTFTYGGSATLKSAAQASDLTRTGYTIGGWSTSDAGAQTNALAANYSSALDLVLYPVWVGNSLTVTYDSHLGSSVSSGSTTTGAIISSAPASPNRAGYAFAGWFISASGGAAIVFPFAHGQTSNFTLHAQWTANPTRTVSYALAGGSSLLPTQSAVKDGLSFTVASTPVKFGYTFTGWSDGSTSFFGGSSYTVGSINVTLTATWSADTLNVTWNSNGGSAVSGSTTVSGGAIQSAPTSPTKSGYDFDGWFKEVSLANEAAFPNFIHGMGENFTLYAKWAASTFTITYKAGVNGTGSDLTQSFVYGNSASLKDATAPLTRAGFSISGWSNSDGGSQSRALEESYASAANLILYPVWSANSNTVTYDEQGGSSVSNGAFSTGSTLTLPSASVRIGYTFQGWYSAASGGTRLGSASATINPADTVAITVYAQWAAIDYTVTYNGNSPSSGSAPTDNASYNIGSAIAVLGNSGNLLLTGYGFGGWTTNSNGTGTVYNSGEGYVFGAANVTFYAKWLANTYTITYNTNGATSGVPTNATQTYTSGNSGISLTTVGSLVKTGYNFGGWATSPSGAALSGAYTTSADVTLYAVWNIKTVSITYAKGSAASASFSDFPTSPQSATYAVRASLASNVDILVSVASATYRFVGWSDGTSMYAAGSSYLLGDTDVTMTAQWVRVLQVRYTLNGGTGVLSGDEECTTNDGGVFLCDANQVIFASTAPNRTGYNFAGWKDQNDVPIGAGTSFTVTSSKYLLYAQWTPINYIVTYAPNGGTTNPTETTKNIGDIFNVANGISRTGHSFNGWSDGTRNYGAGAPYQVSSSNVTLTAQWTANVYTITYDWNGGTGTASANDTYTVGTTGLTLPAVGDHVNDGYSFVGWSETRNGIAVSGAYQATQSRTLYAVWGSGSFTVTYNANGGTASASSASVVNGGSAVLPSATRANYVFEGWYSAQTGGSNRGMAAAVHTPSGSTTLYARWTQLSLYGIDPAHLTRVGSLNASGIDSSYSGSNSGSSVQVTVPANTLPTGTTVNMDLVTDFTRAGNLLTDPNNFIVSLVVSWVASDGSVPNTYSGKAVTVTIQNAGIKAGSSVYSILGSEVTLLGTAINNGTVTVSLTQDPEIVIAATVPTAPQTVTAVAGQTGTANVSWSAPSSTGGSEVASYTVTASTGQTCTTSTTSCAVSGLTSGASYTFTVTATNSVGTSVASAVSSALSFNSAPISSPISGSPNIGAPVVKAPIVITEKGKQIMEVSQKKVATTGGSVLKIDTRNMDDVTSVTVNGKKAKILSVVDGEIKLQIPPGTKGDAKVVFSGASGNVTMEQVISFVAPKPVDVVASAAMPQGVWTIATPAVQALRKTLLANPDTVLINCVGYQSLAYNTALDALVAKQRAKTACQYLASQAPGISVKTSVVRTKLVGAASRKLKVTFSAVR